MGLEICCLRVYGRDFEVVGIVFGLLCFGVWVVSLLFVRIDVN